MSIHGTCQNIKDNAARLSHAMRCDPSDAAAQAALKEFLQRTYSDLASLAWHLGADGDVFQREAVPASELVDDVYFAINREKEFEAPTYRQPYSTLNRAQQGIAR
ncbi:hypothetical protein [Sinorhizobium meliloti]|uniref:hypothetical protein n=1 Tax=Rhizobium meliloti TaxID=382 RepID=UPI000FD7823B|nr:hypothetical protein [Sinorhizobium meliloti]TWB00487.1 hypothetical protein FB000_10936 [Ensifer sp. SEMIA 134]TWB35534.1 hypothetical protein FB001_10836 [Ensifer sp. SEMIA 135]RVG30748.1 hypothetical protein CN229_11930 [Sinorhizobium meliloti]RVL22698.1 hypothetical protein CN147_20275 [Sinorhizobium meliloti]